MKRILCFGDSNAWGYIPGKGTRWPETVRWPKILSQELGPGYEVIEDSISGRTTVYLDPNLSKRCGEDNLGYSLNAHAPIDLMILALGTNDLKFTDAEGAREGMSRLVDEILGAEKLFDMKCALFRGQPKILLVAPPPVRSEISQQRPDHALAGAAEESRKLPQVYRELAGEKHCFYFNASAVVYPSAEDCLHLSEESHLLLGRSISPVVKEILDLPDE